MEIARGEWELYFAELSRQADGYRTTIEVLGDELGDQIEARDVPLRELAFDPREGVAVSVGGHGDEFPVVLRHVIAGPARVQATDEPGVPATIMVEGDDGGRTLIRLRAPVALQP